MGNGEMRKWGNEEMRKWKHKGTREHACAENFGGQIQAAHDFVFRPSLTVLS